jgi:hypothetical protein
MALLRRLGASGMIVATLLCAAPRARAEGDALQIAAEGGRSWDAIVREVQDDTGAAGRTYALVVSAAGSKLACDEYHLTLDVVASEAFALGGCDPVTSATEVRVVARAALFTPGAIVPTPRAATILASRVETATVRGGADALSGGSRVGCSVWLQPYLWDALHARAVALPPDRYEVHTLDQSVHAAPDGAGWVARGESRMAVTFHYEVIDRVSGRRVVESVATLTCADEPVSPRPVEAPPADAQSPASPDVANAPATTATGFDVMTDFGVVFGAPTAGIETGGLRVGLGRRVAGRWYLGASARGTMTVPLGGDDVDGLLLSLQLGPELRYATGLSNDSASWVGVRAGLQKNQGLGEGDGSFAEVAWAPELRLDNVQLGLVLALGATRASSAASPSDVGGYAAMGFRFGLDL